MQVPQVLKHKNRNSFPRLLAEPKQLLVTEDTISQGEIVWVDVAMLENMMNRNMQCKLSEIPLRGGEGQAQVGQSFINRYSNNGIDDDDFVKLAKEFSGQISSPSAIFYKDIKEMSDSILLMYQLSYMHYVLGRHNAMKGRFPYYCCGISSENLLTAFWEAGIISAVKTYCSWSDHAYLIVPFVIKEQDATGIILVDPTSDQLMKDEAKKRRNQIMITTQRNWSYRTDWADGADLYPNNIEVSVCYGTNSKRYDEYVDMAFNNPIIVG